MRWEINGNVLIRVSDSEEESSEQRAKNKSFPHHWDKTQLNMHAEKWKFLSIGCTDCRKTVAKISRRGRRPAYCYSCVIKMREGPDAGVWVSWRSCPSVAFRLTSLRLPQPLRGAGWGGVSVVGGGGKRKTLSSSKP